VLLIAERAQPGDDFLGDDAIIRIAAQPERPGRTPSNLAALWLSVDILLAILARAQKAPGGL
jgi:hypothetical protein